MSEKLPSGKNPNPDSNDAFCVHPWMHLRLQAEGKAQVCCRYRDSISENGAPLSLTTRSFDAIWNAGQMRDIRRDMIEGRKVAACAECYEEDRNGVVSMRTRDNEAWEKGWLNDERLTIADLKARTVQTDYRLQTLPANIEIFTGSLCNLKCRMCHDGVSSRIATDLVHRTWATDQYSDAPYHNPDTIARPAGITRWSMAEALEAAIVGSPDQVRRIYFLGGEPLLVREIGELLQRLIDAGVSRTMDLAVVSNGTVTGSWLNLTEHFKRVELCISIDGFGKHYDYIRHPARWDKLVDNLQTFKQLPNVSLGAAVTLQAYNALRLTTLFRYFDSIDLGFHAWPIHVPRYHNVSVLPPRARQVAADRLSAYANGDCKPWRRDLVQGLADYLTGQGESFDPRLARDFMLFTNDLDSTRKQSIADVDAELVAAYDEAGCPWTSDTLHA